MHSLPTVLHSDDKFKQNNDNSFYAKKWKICPTLRILLGGDEFGEVYGERKGVEHQAN